MNLIFLTMSPFDDLSVHNIYADLLNEFIAHGHKPYLVSPVNACRGQKTAFQDCGDHAVLSVDAGDLGSSSLMKKGLATVMVEYRFLAAIKKYLGGVKFGLILYSTPPVTFAKVIRYLKRMHSAPTYLMLKDIFPQNAVDLGMFRENGLIHKYFRRKERELYAISDNIGCMSQANVDYVLEHNPEIPASKVEICPNCIVPQNVRVSDQERTELRGKYNIPLDSVVFVYGGNLGKPQGIPFIIDCLKTQLDHPSVYFLIVGDGTEYGKLEAFFAKVAPTNMKLMKRLPKKDYDRMIAACDVGLIFLDHRFTIPNFPSRLLSYMQAGLPVLACTDNSSDIRKVIAGGNFGWWCESNEAQTFSDLIRHICADDRTDIGNNAMAYLTANYTAPHCYEIIHSSCRINF